MMDMGCLIEALEKHIKLFSVLSSDRKIQQNIMSVADMIYLCVTNGGSVYLFGNGGSAADAQHIATEFVSRFYIERRAIDVDALTANTSSLTAIANDYSFDKVFVRQLEAKGKQGDVAIGISTSGDSANVVNALNLASQKGLKTVLLTSSRCTIDGKYDQIIKVPSDDTPRIQEMHIFIGHIWAEAVEKMIELNNNW